MECLKKRSFHAAFKLKVVGFAEKSSNRGAGRKFRVDEKKSSGVEEAESGATSSTATAVRWR